MPDAATPRYSVIYADPPWSYRDKAHAGQRGVTYKYGLMDIGAIRRLPVQELAAPDCALFLWVTAPLLPDCLSVVEAWGFAYKTVAFTWVKTYPGTGGYFMGMGSYTRTNAEFCLLGLKGKLVRRGKGVRSLVVAAREPRHSQKPDQVRERIVELFGDLPRIELFARQRVPGWNAWGNELPHSDVQLAGGHFVAAGTREPARDRSGARGPSSARQG